MRWDTFPVFLPETLPCPRARHFFFANGVESHKMIEATGDQPSRDQVSTALASIRLFGNRKTPFFRVYPETQAAAAVYPVEASRWHARGWRSSDANKHRVVLPLREATGIVRQNASGEDALLNSSILPQGTDGGLLVDGRVDGSAATGSSAVA